MADEGRDVDDLMLTIPRIDEGALARSVARRVAHQDAVAATPGFAPLSLSDWLALCEVAGVEAVPSTVFARVPMAVVRAFDSDPAFDGAMRDAAAALETLKAAHPGVRFMTRWDGCSDMWLKLAMNGSGAWSPDFAQVPGIDDERAYEAHALFMPKAEVAMHARPWVDAVVVDGMPLEFRVYVEGGRVAGVSNYHYRRPLPAEPWVLDHAARCLELAGRLLAAQTRPVRLIRGVGEVADPDVNAWTADFVVLPDRGPVFLEGGPSVRDRADPCCFRGRAVEGVALSLDGPAPGGQAAGAGRPEGGRVSPVA